MKKAIEIFWTSFRLSIKELKVNKFRTFLSLFGITIGIFCIIGALSAVDSLKAKVQGDLETIGTSSVYIDKWEYFGGTDVPWWKFVKRPTPKFKEVQLIQERSLLAAHVAYVNNYKSTISFKNDEVTNTNIYGASDEFMPMKKFGIVYGRYMNSSEFLRGNPVTVIGFQSAELLFGNAERALGKTVFVNGKHIQIIGVIEKQGQSIIGTDFDYDNSIILTYRYFASIWDTNDEQNGQPVILVTGKKNVSNEALVDELRGIMRQIRRLSPTTDDNFSLNDVNSFQSQIASIFSSINVGGWIIAGLSLLVGGFGIANIMFVTVRERTTQIGLKKALGARSRTILTEFLLESVFICLIGGILGLLLVYIAAGILSAVLPFPLFIAPHIVLLAIAICIVIGVLSGFIPANTAAKMNPVDAIRSTV